MGVGGWRQAQLTAGAIEEAVSSLDGVVDDIGGNGAVDLPEAEAHLGHVIAAVELDDGSHSAVYELSF
jgi:hypothetical protein